MVARILTIGGREYTPCAVSTLQHDDFTQALLSQSGLDTLEMSPKETANRFAQRMLNTLSKNIDVFELLGALLIPVGTDPLTWTPEMAKETGRHLGDVYLPEDKKLVHREIAGLIQTFLTAEFASAWRIRRSGDSQDRSSEVVSPSSAAPPSAPGRNSFGLSPAIITTAGEPSIAPGL